MTITMFVGRPGPPTRPELSMGVDQWVPAVVGSVFVFIKMYFLFRDNIWYSIPIQKMRQGKYKCSWFIVGVNMRDLVHS